MSLSMPDVGARCYTDGAYYDILSICWHAQFATVSIAVSSEPRSAVAQQFVLRNKGSQSSESVFRFHPVILLNTVWVQKSDHLIPGMTLRHNSVTNAAMFLFAPLRNVLETLSNVILTDQITSRLIASKFLAFWP